MSNDAIEILENVFWTLVGTVRYYIARKMQRLRITFTKSEEARFIGNLDLHRACERTMRRVGADMVFSQGFNPSPKLQLASALPLGITSEAEVLDVWLNESVKIDDLVKIIDYEARSRVFDKLFFDISSIIELSWCVLSRRINSHLIELFNVA